MFVNEDVVPKGEVVFKKIIHELTEHSPFTLFGAMTGIILMMVFRKVPHNTAYVLFYMLHPVHVFLSALATTAIYCRYKPKARTEPFKKFWKVLIIGFLGSVGIGTLSDCLIPLWGEILLEMPHAEAHIGFIEKWWLINPLALAGILIAYFKPFTKLPHAGHVFISTWASLFHMLMAAGHQHMVSYFGVFIFLFLAVWIPCCLSDIIFPLLFVKDKGEREDSCGCSCKVQ